MLIYIERTHNFPSGDVVEWLKRRTSNQSKDQNLSGTGHCFLNQETLR